MNKINFKQSKYMIPLISLPFALYIGFNISEYTGTKEEIKTNEFSRSLGNSDDVADIYDKQTAYDNAYQLQRQQGTAIGGVDAEQDSLAFYNNNLTPSQRRELDSLNAIKRMKREMDRVNMAQQGVNNDYYNPNKAQGRTLANDSRQREEQDYQRNMKLLQAINGGGTQRSEPNTSQSSLARNPEEDSQNWQRDQLKLMREQMLFADSLEKSKDVDQQRQALAQKTSLANSSKRKFYLNSTLPVSKERKSNNFNSFYRENNQSFIKAVVDENIKGYMGSRLKLRLVDDVFVGNIQLPKGTPLFALITGFDAQRVKLSIVSVLYKNQILPINLTIYDVDGMEGLYTPASAFREMSKDMGTNIVQSQGQQLNSGATDFYSTMLTSIYRSSSQTIADVLRKNKVKLKYNTNIYLIDNAELDKKREEIYKSNK